MAAQPFDIRTHASVQATTIAALAGETVVHSALLDGGIQGELGLPVNFDEQYEMSSTLLGVGSFGSVHLATHTASGHEFAVKQLRKDLPRSRGMRGTGRISRDKLLRRLQREIDTMRALDGCLSAISFKGAYETDELVYIVMDVCHGGDLGTLFKCCGALAERQAAMVVYEVLQLLSACHNSGILHGDVKPSNFMLALGNPLSPVSIPAAGASQAEHRAARRDIAAEMIEAEAAGLTSFTISANRAPGPSSPMFCPVSRDDSSASSMHVPYASGWLKGIDFGCSNGAPDHTVLNKITGTPAYMAPEVLARSFGRPADMWSLGVLAYQALSNRLPFWSSEDSMYDNSLDGLKAAVAKPIPWDSVPWLSTSATARDFVSSLLQSNANHRPTAKEALRHQWFTQHSIGGVGAFS